MLAKLIDIINIIDIESTCWNGTPPVGEQSEIIEIGVCTFDVTKLEPIEKQSILIRPVRSRVSEYCTNLTTLTQEMVDNGVTLQQACDTLKNDFLSHKRMWASWGDYDRRMLERQCREMDVHYPMEDTHLNIKNLFAITRGLSREHGLKEALDILNMPLIGTHHRGHDDAWNIGHILSRILKAGRPKLLNH